MKQLSWSSICSKIHKSRLYLIYPRIDCVDYFICLIQTIILTLIYFVFRYAWLVALLLINSLRKWLIFNTSSFCCVEFLYFYADHCFISSWTPTAFKNIYFPWILGFNKIYFCYHQIVCYSIVEVNSTICRSKCL